MSPSHTANFEIIGPAVAEKCKCSFFIGWVRPGGSRRPHTIILPTYLLNIDRNLFRAWIRHNKRNMIRYVHMCNDYLFIYFIILIYWYPFSIQFSVKYCPRSPTSPEHIARSKVIRGFSLSDLHTLVSALCDTTQSRLAYHLSRLETVKDGLAIALVGYIPCACFASPLYSLPMQLLFTHYAVQITIFVRR